MKLLWVTSVAVVSLAISVTGSGREQATATQGQAANGQPVAGAGGGRGAASRQPDPVDFDDHPAWTQLFDGQSLNGWDGNPDVWRMTDGAIVGGFATPVGTRNAQSYLIWQGGELSDFELKLEIKLEGPTADSGIQYRAYLSLPGQGRGGGAAGQTATPPATTPITGRDARWNLDGYQFDLSLPGSNTGLLGETDKGGRGVIAFLGQIVRAEEGKKPRLLSTVGNIEELGGNYKDNDWNQVHLIARGNTFIQMINGHLTAMVIDEDKTKFKPKGLLGIQCSGAGPVKISLRNLWLRKL
jgi:hypothetical protein